MILQKAAQGNIHSVAHLGLILSTLNIKYTHQKRHIKSGAGLILAQRCGLWPHVKPAMDPVFAFEP